MLRTCYSISVIADTHQTKQHERVKYKNTQKLMNQNHEGGFDERDRCGERARRETERVGQG